MAEELISEYIDLDATGKQTAALLGQLRQVEEKFDKLNSIKLNLGDAAGTKQVVTNMREAKAATENLTEETLLFIAAGKEQDKINQQLVNSSVKLAALESQEAKALAIVNKELRDNTAELKNQVRESTAAEGSLEQLRARLILIQKEYDNLSKVEREGADGQALKARVKAATDELKKLEGETGRFQRNVGNYSGAVKVLEKSLDDVNKKLKQNAAESKLSAAAVEMLQNEQSLLETFLERQTAAFSNSAQEIKENTKQLELLAAAGLESSNAYRELFAATSELKDNAADLKIALNNAAPDDVAINAASDAARGLIGVYGLATSVTAIFGEENKAFAETMVKLQAAETALQSIEAIRAIFKKENAVLQARELILARASIVMKNIDTATESKNIVVKYAAIAAQKLLNLTMAAAGGPILILIGTLALLLVTMTAFASQAKEVIRSQGDMAKSYLDYADTIEKTRIRIDQLNAEELADMRRRFATAKQLRDKDLADEINDLGLLEKANADYEQNRYAARKRMFALEAQLNRDKDDEDAQKEYDQLKAADEKYTNDKAAAVEKQTAINVKRLDNERTTVEEIIKAKQLEIDIYKTELTTQSKAFEDLAGNEEKSYAERIEAAKAFRAFQQELIAQEAGKQLLTPGQSPTEIKAIEATRTAALKEVRRSSGRQIEALLKEENERFRKAQLDILKLEIGDAAAAQEAIAENDQKSYSTRLDAAYFAFEKRRAILIAEYEAERQITGRTPEEKIALEKKFVSDSNALLIAYGQKQLELLQINQEQQTELIEREQQKRREAIQRDTDSATSGLNAQFERGLISITKYERKREEIERAGRIRLLAEEVNNTTARVILSKEGSAERIAAEAAWKNATLAYQDEVLSGDIEIAGKRREAQQQLTDQVQEAFKTAALASYDRETNALEEQIAALEKKKQKEIEVATLSIQNEQERAAAIIVIEAKIQAEREAIERRQRQVAFERARAERNITIARIIADTAAAVLNALGNKLGTPASNIAYAKTIGALGLAQLATVLANPPKYKDGKNKHDFYEGPAWVGDGGKKELHISDGVATITPDKPTLTYVKKNDIILPDADEALRDMAMVAFKPVPRPGGNQPNNDAVVGSVNKIGKEIVAAVKNKQELKVTGSHGGVMTLVKYGQDYWKYIDKQVNF